MSCKIIAVDGFRRDAKKLLKKYASLKEELIFLQEQLMLNPRMGTLIHEDTYKIRLAVKSKGKGKSGGMRVITHVIEVEIGIEEAADEQDITVFLLTIYDKSDMENISDADLKTLVRAVKSEMDADMTE